MNILTNTMGKLSTMLINTDKKLAKMGEPPYRTRKATYAEQKKMVQNLSEDDIWNLIETHGVDEVNKLLSRFEEK